MKLYFQCIDYLISKTLFLSHFSRQVSWYILPTASSSSKPVRFSGDLSSLQCSLQRPRVSAGPYGTASGSSHTTRYVFMHYKLCNTGIPRLARFPIVRSLIQCGLQWTCLSTGSYGTALGSSHTTRYVVNRGIVGSTNCGYSSCVQFRIQCL